MEFKDDSTLSELRHLIGQRCQRRTLRGWISVGTVQALELRDEVYVIASTGIRGNRDQKFSMRYFRLDPVSEENRTAMAKEDKMLNRQERLAEKTKKLEKAEAKEAKLKGRLDLSKRLREWNAQFGE
jgi:hypothetical protein